MYKHMLTRKIEDLPEQEFSEEDIKAVEKFNREQREAFERLAKLTDDPLNYWNKEDEYNEELDNIADRWIREDKEKEKPDLSHLKFKEDGTVDINSLPE